MDPRRAYKIDKDPPTGMTIIKVSRQDSKEACANVSKVLNDPKASFTPAGAMLAARLGYKGNTNVKKAMDVVGKTTLNRDSTVVTAGTAMVAGATAAATFKEHLIQEFGTEANLVAVQAKFEAAATRTKNGEKPRLKARLAAGVDTPDGSVASSDASTISWLTDDGKDPNCGKDPNGGQDPEVEAVVTFHKARAKMGQVDIDDFLSSWTLYYGNDGGGKPAAKPTAKPVATPPSSGTPPSGSSSSGPGTGNGRKKRRGT